MKKIYVVGIGPGNKDNMTFKAVNILEKASYIIGYKKYTEQIKCWLPEKNYIESSMKDEIKRCQHALNLCNEGKTVALISGGDANIYGMAGLIHEVIIKTDSKVDIEVVPGVSALNACAAMLGAPITNDFVAISLSDLLTPIDLILQRIKFAAMGDFVICLYNPRSKGRPDNLKIAVKILLENKSVSTPVGIVKNAFRENSKIQITTLGNIDYSSIDMNCTVIIGSSVSYIFNNKIITPRGYVFND